MKKSYKRAEEEVSDLIVEIAQFVEEENWDYVMDILLDMSDVSYRKGYEDAGKVIKLLQKK